jgi:hypothetical protein
VRVSLQNSGGRGGEGEGGEGATTRCSASEVRYAGSTHFTHLVVRRAYARSVDFPGTVRYEAESHAV